MLITRFQETQHCPKCEAPMDAATAIQGDAIPSPGDLSMCSRCTSFLLYSDEMKLQLLPDADFDVLPQETREELLAARAWFTEVNRRKLSQ